ncbi:MAG: hypothetical protein ACYC27_06505 [Armatimonadota bacterium]
MRYLRNTGIVIFGIVIVITAILAVMAAVFHHGLNVQLTKLRSSGKYSSMADFKTEKVPDDQNAATIYTQMLKEQPKITLENINKLSDPRRLRQILNATENGKNADLWDEARTIVNRNRKIYNQLDEAVKKPYCVFLIDWSQPYEKFFKYMSIFRDSYNLLCAKALLDAKDGKPDYLHSIYTSIKMNKSLVEIPDTTTQIFRYGNLMMICSSIVRSFEYQSMSESEVINLRNVLSEIDIKDGLSLALRRERLSSYDFSPDIVSLSDLLNYDPLIDPPSEGVRGLMYSATNGAFGVYYRNVGQYGDEAVWLRYVDKQIKSMDLSYKESVKQGLIEPQLPTYAAFSRGLAPTYAWFQLERYQTEACLSGTQTILALHAYQNRYRSYPSSLDELRSKLGWEIPVDPFSDKDFVYKKDGKGFLLYSIGPNMKDDGGGLDYYKQNNRKGDIIWKMDR